MGVPVTKQFKSDAGDGMTLHNNMLVGSGAIVGVCHSLRYHNEFRRVNKVVDIEEVVNAGGEMPKSGN